MAARTVIALAGSVLVAGYAVLLGVDALVLDPRAAAPWLTPAELEHALAGSDWRSARTLVLVAVALGVLLPAVGVVLVARLRPPARAVAAAYLVLLALGGPVGFVVTFATGMTVADELGVSGGVHSSTGVALRVVAVVASCAAVAAVVLAARRPAPAHAVR
ncbi:hypothetical protein [Cellulomonas wangsupingiae]|uniref:hypothetical protein n=1 Tax=Cellulomonas wangsupingiae TaxID=2968085 RepID=UPI001D0DD288|nr:hypothetical protein [Cellulomonas wangsupingiae]MCM0641018.1 hypothetical protein [Cellulomonas wangsupingiae]